MHIIFGFLLIFLVGFLVFFLIIVGNLLKLFFKVKKATKKFTEKEKPAYTTDNRTNTSSARHSNSERPSSNRSGKHFDKSEGEYVEFEEI